MKKIFIIFLIFSCPQVGSAQTVADGLSAKGQKIIELQVADSLSAKGQKIIERQIDKSLEDKLSPFKWIAGTTVFGITAYAIFLWFYGLKKQIETAIQTKAQAIVEEKIAKSVDIKVEELRQLLNESNKHKVLKASARIAIINKQGKYLALSNEIEKNGFKTDDYRQMDKLSTEIGINTCNFIVIDNSDNAYPEKDVVAFFDMYKERIKILYLATSDLSTENFQKYRNSVKIIKLLDRLGDTINNALN